MTSLFVRESVNTAKERAFSLHTHTHTTYGSADLACFACLIPRLGQLGELGKREEAAAAAAAASSVAIKTCSLISILTSGVKRSHSEPAAKNAASEMNIPEKERKKSA